LVRRAFDGKIPDEVLYKKLKGQQSSDWMQRFTLVKDHWKELFAGLPDDHPAHKYINANEFVKLIEVYDSEGTPKKGIKTALVSGMLARVAGLVYGCMIFGRLFFSKKKLSGQKHTSKRHSPGQSPTLRCEASLSLLTHHPRSGNNSAYNINHKIDRE